MSRLLFSNGFDVRAAADFSYRVEKGGSVSSHVAHKDFASGESFCCLEGIDVSVVEGQGLLHKDVLVVLQRANGM